MDDGTTYGLNALPYIIYPIEVPPSMESGAVVVVSFEFRFLKIRFLHAADINIASDFLLVRYDTRFPTNDDVYQDCLDR